MNDKENNFIKFLGTAGARFVMLKQLRSSGGIWLRYKDTNLIIDPGPGAIVRCHNSRPKLNPAALDGIILTHKHLDHCGDINVMIEAMTEAGLKKRGIIFIPQDAVGEEGVIFKYLCGFPQEIKILEKGKFSLKDINFEVPITNIHSVMTYGLKFYFDNKIIAFLSDTKYFDGLIAAYRDSTIIILNVVFYQRREPFEHLCLDDAIKIIKEIRPQKTILTHFGMSMLKEKPYLLEKKLQLETGQDVKFATDGFSYNF